jgi:uncharacterized protein
MKLYRGKIKPLASDIVEKLITDGDIEVIERFSLEVKLDLEAIMQNYLRLDAEVVARARNLMGDDDGMGFSKLRKMVAEDMDFLTGDDGIDWIINQMLDSFMINSNVEEVFSPDNVMRKKMIDLFRKHLDVEEQIETEVRERIKHVKEGTRAWDMEYRKVRREIEKKRGLA